MVAAQPNIFGKFTLEADLVNGHMHYTSLDGTMAIAYATSGNFFAWYIQTVDQR